MPGSFTYDEATNTIEVTGGTSSAPATFNDMFLADQVGMATDLLLAEAGTSAPGNSLTYPIRSAYDKALIIKCIVAGKTAEADFIFITGTDAWGASQTESLDVTAGNGTYTTTKRFATATEFDCSDNAAGGGVQWADGTIQVTQDIWGVVWEIVADAQYKIGCDVDFGDGLTATFFRSEKGELVYFDDSMTISIKNSASCEMGSKTGDWGLRGAAWNVGGFGATLTNPSTGTFNIYASLIHTRDTISNKFEGGTLEILNSIFSQRHDLGYHDNRRCIQLGGTVSATIKDVFLNGGSKNLFMFGYSSLSIDDLHSHAGGRNVVSEVTGVLISNARVTSALVGSIVTSFTANVTMRDSKEALVDMINDSPGGKIIEQYTCNIHIADEDGANLQAVSITCATFGNVVSNDAGSTFYKCIVDHTSGVFADDVVVGKWELTTAAYAALAGCAGAAKTGAWVTGIDYVKSANEFTGIVTDASGNIAEQTIDYKKWFGTSEALLTHSPHIFTLTYGGDTHIVSDFVVDNPIVWHLEFPPQATILSHINNLLADLTTDDSGGVQFTQTALQNAPGVDADAILDEDVDGSITLRQAQRLLLSILTGKSSGGGTPNIKFRDLDDTKDRLDVTVDANGNRTAINVRDGT